MDGKYPLHFVLASYFNQSSSTSTTPRSVRRAATSSTSSASSSTSVLLQSEFMLIETLLKAFSEAMFKEYCDETSVLKRISPTSSESTSSVRQAEVSTSSRRSQQREDDVFADLTVSFNNEQYAIETVIQRWIPISKIQESLNCNSRLKSLFSFHLTNYTKQYMMTTTAVTTSSRRRW
jgi:hypothetical protein